MIKVRMLREWKYDFHDDLGEIATRICPKGLVLDFEDEIAAAAVAEGAAETTHPQPAEFAERVRVYKRWLDLMGEGLSPDEAATELAAEETARAEEAEKAKAAGAKAQKTGKVAADAAAKAAKEKAEADEAEAEAKAAAEAAAQAEKDKAAADAAAKAKPGKR